MTNNVGVKIPPSIKVDNSVDLFSSGGEKFLGLRFKFSFFHLVIKYVPSKRPQGYIGQHH